jgi:hypothetical protein
MTLYIRICENSQIDRMVARLGALVVVVAGLLFGALHYWPPNETAMSII